MHQNRNGRPPSSAARMPVDHYHRGRPHKTGMELAWDVARRMPESWHYIPGRRFSIAESQAVDWLCAQPACRQLLWNMMKPALTLDVKKCKWRGIETPPID